MAHTPSSSTLFDERSSTNGMLLHAPPRRIRLTLRSQIVLVMLLLIVLGAGIYVWLRQSVTNSFDDLQRESIQRDTQRVVNALDTQLQALDNLARNWAASPAVIKAIEGDSAAFAAQMNDTTLKDFDLNVLLILTMRGDLAFGKVYDTDSGKGLILSPALANAYLSISGLGLDMDQVAHYTDGVLMLPTIDLNALQAQAQMLVPQLDQFLQSSSIGEQLEFNISGNSGLFAHEIIYAHDSVEPQGIIILGRLMLPEDYEEFGSTTQTRLTAMPLDMPDGMPADFRAARDALLAGEFSFERILNDKYAAGYSLLNDMRGHPALILRVETERHFSQRALDIINQAIGGFVGAGLIVLSLVWLLLEWTVIRRMVGLSRFVRRVGESGDVSLRAPLTGYDELTDLGANINAMLASLQESRQMIVDNRLQLEEILASISDIVYMVELTPTGKVLRHRIPSPQIATLTGYPQASFDADFTFWQSLIVPGDLDGTAKFLDHPAPYEDSQIEYRIVNAADQTYWIRDRRRLRPVASSDNVIVYGVLSDITAQKAAEVALAAERNLLRAVIDIQLHSVYVKDRQRRIVLCNPADAQWRNIATPEDALGKTDEDFYPPEVAAQFTADDLYVMEHDQPVINREEIAPYGDNKEQHWLLTTKVPLHDAQGRVIGLVGVGQDITDRKRMEEELRRAKEDLELRVEQRTAEVAYERNLLRTLIDAVPDHIFIKDTESRFLTMNRAAALARGYSSPEEATGTTDFDHFDPDIAARFRAEELRLLRGEVAILNGERAIGENDPAGVPGGWYWTIKVPIRQADGSITGLVGIGRDISERKRMEFELRQARTVLEQRVKERTADLRAALIELRQSEERFEQAFMCAPSGIALIGMDGRFIKVNSAMAEMLGYDEDDMEGMTIEEVTYPDDRTLTKNTLELVQNRQDVIYHYEKRFLHRDGSVIWASVTSSLVRHADDSPAYLVGQAQNITERKRSEAEREALMHKIQTRANELATVAEISRQATTILDADRLLQTVVDLIRTNFDFYNVCIFRLDDSGQLLIPAAGSHTIKEEAENVTIPIDTGVSLIARAARLRETVLANDTLSEPAYLQNLTLTKTRSELVMPLIVGDELIGILNIEDDQPNRFTTDDVNILVTLAAQLANALHNARLFTENGRRLAIIEQSTDLIALSKMQEPLLVNYVNSAGARMVGAASPDDVINCPAINFYTPESVARLRQEILPVVLTEGTWRGEQTMQRLDGSTFPVELTILALPGKAGQPPDLATINTDITRRKQAEAALNRANRAYRVLSECNQAMVHADSEQDLLRAICQIIVRASGYHAAWVAYTTQDLTPEGTFTGDMTMQIVGYASASPTATQLTDFTVTQAQMAADESPTGRALRSCLPVVIADLAGHPGYAAYREWITKQGFVAGITLPLVIDGRPIGVFTVYSRDCDAFDPGEVDLLVELAGDLSYGISVQRARREREDAQDKLREANIKLGLSNRSLITLHDVGRTLTTALDAPTIYDVLYGSLLQPLFKGPTCLISLYDAANSELTCAFACVQGRRIDPASVPVQPAWVGVRGEAIRTRQPRLIRYDPALPGASDQNTPSDDVLLTLGITPAVGVVVPLISGDQVLGVLHILHADADAISEDDIPVVSVMANQTAAALQNAQLFAAEREQRSMAEALRDVTTAINGTLDLTTVMDCILDNIQGVVPHDTASIMLVQDGYARIMRHRGFEERGLSAIVSTLSIEVATSPKLSQMKQTGQPVISADVSKVNWWEPLSGLEWVRGHIGAPILLGGELLGVINLDSATEGFFTAQSARRLQAFADQASMAIQNARLFSAEREQRMLAEALRDITAAINSTLNVDRTLALILENVGIVVPHSAANIMLIDRDSFYVAAHRGYDAYGITEHMDHWRRPMSERSALVRHAALGEPLLINDTRTFPDWADEVEGRWIRSMIAMPIQVDGQTIGMLNLDHAEPNAFSPEQIERLQVFVTQASTAMRNAQLFAAEREQRAFAEALSDTAASINRILDPGAVVNHILDNITQIIPYDAATIMVVDEDGIVRMPHHRGYLERGAEEWLANWQHHTSTLYFWPHLKPSGEVLAYNDVRQSDEWMADLSPEIEWIGSSIKAPIVVEGRVAGIINLDCAQPGAFTALHIARLRSFAELVANALYNARLFAAERGQRVLAEALRDTAAAINSSLDFDTVLERILDHLQQVIPHDAANVMFIEDGVARIVRGHGYAERGLGDWIEHLRFTVNEVPIWQRMLVNRKPFVIADTHQDADWMGFCTQEEAWIRSTAKAPILIDGELIGILHIDSATPKTFNTSHAERLQAFAHQAANAIRNARLFAAERDQRAFAEALSDSVAAINSAIQPDEVMDRILINVEQVAPFDMAEILLIDGEEAYLARYWQARPNLPISAEAMVLSPRIKLADTPNLRAMAETGQPCVIANTRSAPDWIVMLGWEWIRSQAAAPIKRRDHVIGFLMLDSAMPNFYTPAVGERLQAFADQAALALYNADLYARVQNYAEEQKQAVLNATAELAAQHAQLQTILDTMAEGLIFSVGDELKYANRACEELLGRPVSSQRAGYLQVLDMIGPASARQQDIQGRIIRTLEHGRTWQGDLSLVRSDGHEFDAAVSVTPVPGPSGDQPAGQLTMIRDISQEKALHAQRERFIAHASHELRTPLANIKTRLYLLKNQPEKLDQHMTILERVSNDMNELIENLLDVSRFERGVNSLALRPVVLQDLVRETVMIQQAEAELKHITLESNLPPTPFHAQVDPNRMRQVFTNLITNAINYTSEGGSVTVSLEADPAHPGRRVICRVRDTGVGIAPDQLKHVFEPFFRANQGMATGTGLGLSIAKEIVLLHQGEITVDSAPGQGSTFSVTLDLIE